MAGPPKVSISTVSTYEFLGRAFYITNPMFPPISEEQKASFYCPSPIPEGYYYVGGYSTNHFDSPTGTSYIVKIENDPDAFKKPLSYERIWNFADLVSACSVWWPVAPQGYVTIGGIGQKGNNSPSEEHSQFVEKFRCIKAEYVNGAGIGDKIWEFTGEVNPLAPDVGSGWHLVGNGSNTGCFIPNNSAEKPNRPVFWLKPEYF